MRTGARGLAWAFAVPLAVAVPSVATPLHAQWVDADVVVHSGPVAGHIGVHDGYSTYRRPAAVVYERPARVIVVERSRYHFRHWKRHGYRPVRIYYVDGRYYDRGFRGAREVVVYERDGRYYRDCDNDWYDRRDDRYRDRDRDWDD